MAITIDGTNTPTLGGVGYGDGTELAFSAAGTAGQVLTSAGGAAPTWVTPGGLAAATQAEMEAATSNTVAATPSNLNWHPGIAKAWLKCDSAGNINSSYNIASISDVGTGNVRATFTTAFSSVNYVMIWSGYGGAALGYVKPNDQSTTVTEGICYVTNTAAQTDPFRWFLVAYGDQ